MTTGGDCGPAGQGCKAQGELQDASHVESSCDELGGR